MHIDTDEATLAPASEKYTAKSLNKHKKSKSPKGDKDMNARKFNALLRTTKSLLKDTASISLPSHFITPINGKLSAGEYVNPFSYARLGCNRYGLGDFHGTGLFFSPRETANRR